MLQPLRVDGPDLVHVEIQLGRLGGNTLGVEILNFDIDTLKNLQYNMR